MIVFLSELLSLIRWHCHAEFMDIVILNCHYQSDINQTNNY